MSPPDDMVPRAALVAVAESFNALKVLEKRRAATQAQLIRGCVQALRKENPAFGMDKIREHKKNQDKALIYLEALATMLEDQSNLSDNPTAQSTEGEPPCTSA